MNKKILILLSGLLLIGIYSCNKLLDVDSSRLANEENNWHKLEDTRSSLMGMYGLLRAALADENAHWLWGELRSGDFQSKRSDLNAIINGQLNATYPTLKTITNWRRFYAVINAAGIFIEKAERVLAEDPRYTEMNYKVDVAQARVIRAFAYFYMVRIWGDVPLITATNDGTFIQTARTDKTTVLAFAESEILKSVNSLPFVYGKAGDDFFPGDYYGSNDSRWNGVLMTRISAYAILAHIAAWQQHYFDCAVYTDYIMNNYTKSSITNTTMANLTTSTSSPFFDGHKSSHIIAAGFANTVSKTLADGTTGYDQYFEYTNVGHIEQMALAYPMVTKPRPDIYVTRDSILRIFPYTRWDQRFGFDTLNGLPREPYFTNYYGEEPMFSKIKCVVGGTSTGTLALFSSALVFTRLEEITLLRAEALAVIGQRDEAGGLLNNIRASRGLPGYVESGETDLIDAIFSERRRELMGESWRWYDLVRYNMIKKNDPVFMNLINQGGIYWPVSSDVLQNNPKVTQNSYWK